jgi:hypothetical protein
MLGSAFLQATPVHLPGLNLTGYESEGYCPANGTGVSSPIGVGVSAGGRV